MDSQENKVTKPSDNVLTPEQTPSYTFGLTIAIAVISVGIFLASLYFGILKI